jgi:hypothetical protein
MFITQARRIARRDGHVAPRAPSAQRPGRRAPGPRLMTPASASHRIRPRSQTTSLTGPLLRLTFNGSQRLRVHRCAHRSRIPSFRPARQRSRSQRRTPGTDRSVPAPSADRCPPLRVRHHACAAVVTRCGMSGARPAPANPGADPTSADKTVPSHGRRSPVTSGSRSGIALG